MLTVIAGLRTCAIGAELPAPVDVDARRATAAGVRELESRHVRLLTDVPVAAGVDELPAVFDAALPLWCEYFGVPRERVDASRWQGSLIVDRQKFDALGLIPPERRDFINGYADGWNMWMMDQPSDYYRRHLLLHEGTHAFMLTQLGSCGPGWYMEGMAELLATHRWEHAAGSTPRLRLAVFPARKDDVPMWGRIKLIRDAAAAGQAWPIERVLRIDSSRPIPTEEYAWAWALCALLDEHPQFQERFRTLKQHVADPRFTERFRKLFAEDWDDLAVEWQAFVAALDYGFDIPKMAMTHREAAPIEAGATRRATIKAGRGWQSTGWLLHASEHYQLTATGRFRIAVDPESGKAWPCEPGGVTIEYHDGRPLGALLAALRPVDWDTQLSPGLRPGVDAEGAPPSGGTPGQSPGLIAREPSFSNPKLVGLDAAIIPTRDAILYLRVNDSPAKLADNAGDLQVVAKNVGR